MKQYSSLTLVTAFIASIAAGFLDIKLGYASLPHLIILVAAAILSAFNRKQAMFIALMLGTSIPVAHGLAGILGIKPPYEMKSAADVLSPIILGIGGAFIGVKVSINMPKPQTDEQVEEAKL